MIGVIGLMSWDAISLPILDRNKSCNLLPGIYIMFKKLVLLIAYFSCYLYAQVGLLEEEKVLSSVAESRESTSRMDGAMKKTRFYLAQDQESIGTSAASCLGLVVSVLQHFNRSSSS